MLRWQDEALGGDGFLPWTPFDHPRNRPGEIGGWKRMFTFRHRPHYLGRDGAPTAASPCVTPPCAKLRLRDVNHTAGRRAVADQRRRRQHRLSADEPQQAVAMHEAKPVAAELSGPPEMNFVQGAWSAPISATWPGACSVTSPIALLRLAVVGAGRALGRAAARRRRR